MEPKNGKVSSYPQLLYYYQGTLVLAARRSKLLNKCSRPFFEQQGELIYQNKRASPSVTPSTLLHDDTREGGVTKSSEDPRDDDNDVYF